VTVRTTSGYYPCLTYPSQKKAQHKPLVSEPSPPPPEPAPRFAACGFRTIPVGPPPEGGVPRDRWPVGLRGRRGPDRSRRGRPGPKMTIEGRREIPPDKGCGRRLEVIWYRASQKMAAANAAGILLPHTSAREKKLCYKKITQ